MVDKVNRSTTSQVSGRDSGDHFLDSFGQAFVMDLCPLTMRDVDVDVDRDTEAGVES